MQDPEQLPLFEMSQNVTNVTFNEMEQTRWEQFKFLKDTGLTDEEIAGQWGLTSRRQVIRLKVKAKQNGEYQKWLNDKLSWITEDFKEIHAKIKRKHPKLAYSVMAALYAKTIPSQSLTYNKEDVTITNNRNYNLKNYSEEDKTAIIDAYRRLNKNDGGTTQPNSIH